MEFARTYSEIRRGDFRNVMRSAALCAKRSGMRLMGTLEAALAMPRVQIVLLHHVFEDEEASFAEALKGLTKQHTFISYSEAVRKIAAGTSEEIDRAYLAFSFDDGFRNCVRAGQLLKEFGATGCFFVCPGIVGEHDERVISKFCTHRLELPRAVEFMDWDDLAELKKGGHEIGGHTMNHVRLSAVSPSEADEEIRGSYAEIERQLGRPAHFAWTYGRFEDVHARAVHAVFEAGYASCASGVRGAHPPPHSSQFPAGGSAAGPDTPPTAAIRRTTSCIEVRRDATPWSGRPCIRRDHIVMAWGLGQIEYLLARNAKEMSERNREWPTFLVH